MRNGPTANAGSLQSRLAAAGWALVGIVAAVFAWKMVRITWLHSAGAGIDFAYFWDAAVKVVHGEAAQAYTSHTSVAGKFDPLAYPPPLLLVLAPLGLLGFGPALVLWLGLTGLAYITAARQPVRLALVNPPAAYNVLFGQTGFLTSSIMLAAANSLSKRPLVGGALFGCMVVKPHLAILVPVALIAGRKWASLAASAASAAALVTLAAIAFGGEIYRAWWAATAQYGEWLADGYWSWQLIASPYAVLRWSGATNAAALAGQGLVAVCAALLVIKSWRENWDCKVAVLAAAAVLVSPYSFAYDAVLLIAPLGWLAARLRWGALGVWAILMAQLLKTSFFNFSVPLREMDLPNTTPFAAVLCLVLLWTGRHRRA